MRKSSHKDKDINDAGRTARVTHSCLFPKLQLFSRKGTLKGWTVSSDKLIIATGFILLIHLLKKLLLGMILLMKRPYKSQTNQSQSLRTTNPLFQYSKDNSCGSIETKTTKIYFNAVVIIWHSYIETKATIKTKAHYHSSNNGEVSVPAVVVK